MKNNRKIIHSSFISLLTIAGIIFIISIIPSTRSKASGDLTGKTANEIVAEMGIGWNLGNTFDATGGNRSNIYSQETSWGNPQVTQELIQKIHDTGFKTIRIPVTWMNQINNFDGAYTINPDFLARVKEVVDYAYELDMYIILNLHHESWLNTSKLSSDYEEIGVKLAAVWNQIADYFADYDQHLIFEGMNEPRLAGTASEWSGNQYAFNAVNYLDQVFAYTIRNNGKGHNDERCLMIPGYAASSSADILKTITLPTYKGETVKNLIISVHCYNPYDFCLSDNMSEFDASNKNHTYSIDTVFKNLEEEFLFYDIPVVMGETGATNTNDNTEARENWAKYMGQMAYKYGIPIVIWDNGASGHSGGECHAWINRKTCEWNYSSIIKKLFEADDYINWGEQTEVDKLAFESTPSTLKKTSYIVLGKEYLSRYSFRNGIPVIDGFKFLGWYTTKDYREGTEFEFSTDNPVIAYAKFGYSDDEDAEAILPPEPTVTPVPTEAPKPTESAELTATPEPTETLKPTSVPENEITSAPAKEESSSSNSDSKGVYIPIIILSIVIILAGVFIAFKKIKK